MEIHTPPYLTCEPEIRRYAFYAQDRMLILATDGLWDMLSNDVVVRFAAAHLEGRAAEEMLDMAQRMGVEGDELTADSFAYAQTENCATFLIRMALAGYNAEEFSWFMSLPSEEVRLYRDDITVLVVMLK